MNTGQTLSSRDREFLRLVARAIFTNPFSEERLALDARIAGVQSVRELSEERRIQLLMPPLVSRLEKKEFSDIQAFTGEDRKLVEYAWLFSCFHHYIERLDGLIQTQLEAGDESSPVPFAGDVLHELRLRGFSRAESLRFLALFYQLRRAYYFIDKGLVGRSPPMKKLRLALWNNVFTHDIALYDSYLWNRMEDFSTLLLGETGTGKGTAAAAIGRSGYIPFNEKRSAFEESFTRTFLAINLSQFPETLIESELFGHRKGAFTGAMENHDGVFALGSPHGALFLDEIGEVSVPVQIKLLQVLQERTFSPVGSHVKKRFEGRVIAATNKPIEKIRAQGVFRDDFFYRLCSDVIVVPPLRQRLAEDPGELDDLIDLLVKRIIREPSTMIFSSVRDSIDRCLPHDYSWPGNVRELEQAVRRILLNNTYSGDTSASCCGTLETLVSGIEAASLDAREMMRLYCSLLYERFGSYEEVARRTGFDRRTAKKYIDQGRE